MRTLLIGAASVTMILTGTPAAQANHGPSHGIQGTYSNWQLPVYGTGYSNIDSHVWVAHEPAAQQGQYGEAYFLAHQFWMNNGNQGGEGGYIGLQKDDQGERAIWSIWGAVRSECNTGAGATCGSFQGAECCGQRIVLPYDWRAGKLYRYRLWAVGDYPDGTRRWVGAIRESNGFYDQGVETVVGYIYTELADGWLHPQGSNWIEWYGPHPPTCSGYPRVDATFYPTTGHGWTAEASLISNQLGGDQYSCPSRITPGWGQRHQMPYPGV